MFKRVTHSNILSITRKKLKINIIEASKDSILIITENIKYKDSKIKSIKKELSLNIYHHTHQTRQKSPRVPTKLYSKKLE